MANINKILVLALCFGLSVNSLAQISSEVYVLKKARKEEKETGYKQSLISGKSVDFEPYSVHYTTVKPGQYSHAAHKHEAEELIIVKEGSIELSLNDKIEKLTKGDVAIISPNTLHGIQNIGNKKAQYMVMLLKNKDVANFHSNFQSKVIHWDSTTYTTHNLGGRRNFFDGPTGQCKRFEMHVTQLNVGNQSHPPHTHRAAEILIPIMGKTEEYIDGKWIPASIGDIIYLECKSSHAIKNAGKTPCSYFAFQFE